MHDRVHTIGGEFALEQIDEADRPSRSVLDWLRLCAPDNDVTLYASGRGALRAWLIAQAASGRDTLVLPAFVCQSVIDATEGTGSQWILDPLPVGADLEPDATDIVAAARRHGERGCILAIPLFGWNYSESTVQALQEGRVAGGSIAWDVTHGLVSSWTAATTGHRVASLRKWCGVIDGGVGLGVSGRASGAPQADDDFLRLRRSGMLAKRDWLAGAPGRVEADFLEPLHEAELILDGREDVHEISAGSRAALEFVSVDRVMESRRGNAAFLSDALLEVPEVQLLRPDLPPGVCPFAVPVRATNRDALRSFLATHRAFCPVHWPLPAEIDATRFADDQRLSAEILTLPCDQRLDSDDMLRLVDLIRAFYR